MVVLTQNETTYLSAVFLEFGSGPTSITHSTVECDLQVSDFPPTRITRRSSSISLINAPIEKNITITVWDMSLDSDLYVGMPVHVEIPSHKLSLDAYVSSLGTEFINTYKRKVVISSTEVKALPTNYVRNGPRIWLQRRKKYTSAWTHALRLRRDS